MRGFFENDDRIGRLGRELRRWEGTPCLPGAAICGGGSDCVRTVDAILSACGWVGAVEWPDYTLVDRPAKLLDALDGIALLSRLEGTDQDQLRGGDLLAGKNKRSGAAHLAVLERPDRIWHMSPRKGWRPVLLVVALGAWDLLGVYRPVEVVS